MQITSQHALVRRVPAADSVDVVVLQGLQGPLALWPGQRADAERKGEGEGARDIEREDEVRRRVQLQEELRRRRLLQELESKVICRQITQGSRWASI
jgi:hypothetical protein